MNAIDLLMQDHREVERLFRQFQRADRKEQKKRIAAEVVKALSIHAAIEEQLLYPSIRERVKALEDLTLEALEEHHVAKWLVSEVDSHPVDHERFDAKVSVLAETIRHHVKEEERQLFPKMRRAFRREELEKLGELLEEAKQAAPTHPHPRLPDHPPGNVVAGPLAALVDRARDLVRGGAERGLSMVRRERTAKATPRRAVRSAAKAKPRRASRSGSKRTARKTAAKTRRAPVKRKASPRKRR